MATMFSASLRPTRTRILLIALAIVLLLGYGLFAAQRARSATLAKKVYAEVNGFPATPVVVNGSHVVSVTKAGQGNYNVKFDRHVDNCAFATALSDANTSTVGTAVFVEVFHNSAGHTDTLLVRPVNRNNVLVDNPFSVIGLCPST